MKSMSTLPYHSSLLARDRKLFLELTTDEAEVWVTRVFDRIRPQMHIISLLLNEGEPGTPLNLEAVLVIASESVREVAVEMAGVLFTPERLARISPLLNAYCDELLARGRALDATFVQRGLIDLQAGFAPGQNSLLVEICLRSIHHQVNLINGSPRAALTAH
jgi:hypothetical protein